MAGFVSPKVFMVGYSVANLDGLEEYLKYTGQELFAISWRAAKEEGLSDAECLCSFYAKLCYKSLILGENKNVSTVRDIPDNFLSILSAAHGSVLEHCCINFVATDVSRVLTHELVRMRAGWAYSQTSGRYVRGDEINVVWDDILAPIKEGGRGLLSWLEAKYAWMCNRMGLNGINCLDTAMQQERGGIVPMEELREEAARLGIRLDKVGTVRPEDEMTFTIKKKITSALRRFLPNGQSNEIGFSINLRAIRHFVMLRSNRGAENEIRNVTEQVYGLVKAKYPLLFHGAKEERVDGHLEVTGLKMQPYEVDITQPEALQLVPTSTLEAALASRSPFDPSTQPVQA